MVARGRQCSSRPYHLTLPSISPSTLSTNIGIPHGVFLKRQTLMKPDGETPYELTDFFIGNEISVNSRVFRVVDADGYTRKFLSETMSVALGNAES